MRSWRAAAASSWGYFLLSDAQTDADLRRLFVECGCGHLFEMMRPEARSSALRMAGETRRHLQMSPAAQRGD
jgi:hypothetical protein